VRPPLAAEHAALLAGGPDAVLSHQTAARIHGLTVAASTPADVHVTLAQKSRRQSHTGVKVHRSTTLHRDDHHRLHGLRVTSVARTAVDLSPTLTARGRERLVDEALRKTSRTKLVECVQRHRGRPGVPALQALLDPTRPTSLTWSAREERLRRMFSRAGLPAPESNVELDNGYIPDLLWREPRVIVEYDSEQFHLARGPFHHDRARRNRLETDGYRVLPITSQHADEEILVWVVRALYRNAG
jgi:hypothetical protein